MRRTLWLSILGLSGLVAGLVFATGIDKTKEERSAKDAALEAATGGDVESWLKRARPAETQPTSAPQESPDRFQREDALPGVVELSNGKLLGGWLYTTREQPLSVYVEKERRWRRVPLITVLSIKATVVEEKMEQEWRWKEMGVPERVYTGKEYPTRRVKWRFHLIDDSYLSGAVKGQPLWVEHAGKKFGPFVLHERSKGKAGQKLEDLIYIKQVLISRRMMGAVLKDQENSKPGAEGPKID